MEKQTKELQYMEMLDMKRVTMGILSGYSYLTDPKRVSFVTSRYKFVSKIFDGYAKVLELGCADGFYSSMVMEAVDYFIASDFEPIFIDDAKSTHPFRDKMKFIQHDMVCEPMSELFDGIFSLDVLEHIEKSDEDKFMKNTLDSLSKNGVCIVGMPSLESQVYASEISKKGHVNCKSGNEFKSFMKKYFDRVMMFSMNDEVIHTGYMPMSQYLLAVCMYPKIEE